jgi:hypothetical protein
VIMRTRGRARKKMRECRQKKEVECVQEKTLGEGGRSSRLATTAFGLFSARADVHACRFPSEGGVVY